MSILLSAIITPYKIFASQKLRTNFSFLRTLMWFIVSLVDCEISYVGETLQHLGKRVTGHKSDEKKAQKDTNRKITDGTALSQHARDKNHSFNFNNIAILHKESNIKKRKIREVIEIIKRKTCNFKTDTRNSDCMYGDVLRITHSPSLFIYSYWLLLDHLCFVLLFIVFTLWKAG